MWTHNATFQSFEKEQELFPNRFLNKGKEPVTIARSAEKCTQELRKLCLSFPWQHNISPASYLRTTPSTPVMCKHQQPSAQAETSGFSDKCGPYALSLFCTGNHYMLLFVSVSLPHFLTIWFVNIFASCNAVSTGSFMGRNYSRGSVLHIHTGTHICTYVHKHGEIQTHTHSHIIRLTWLLATQGSDNVLHCCEEFSTLLSFRAIGIEFFLSNEY